jgi:hypothetical protein
MRRALAVSLAVVILAASMIVAHASTLTVNAGYLQVLQAGLPENGQVTINVVVYLRAGQSGNWQAPVTHEHSIGDGYSYVVRLTSGTRVDCPTAIDGNPIHDPQGFGSEWGPFALSDSPVTHTVCGRTGDFDFALDPVAPLASADTAGTLATDAMGTDELEVLSPRQEAAQNVVRHDDPAALGENCVDGGWQYLAAADGQPYADEQACVDDQVQYYNDNLQADGS